MAASARCAVAAQALNLNGHVHSEDCGHERISHGDHMDYLVRAATALLYSFRSLGPPDCPWMFARMHVQTIMS